MINNITTEITDIHNMKNQVDAMKIIQSLADEHLMNDNTNSEIQIKLYDVEVGQNFDIRG